LKNKVPNRDQVFQAKCEDRLQPVALAKTETRFANIAFTEKGIALLTEFDRPARRVRTWVIEPGAEPRKLWDRKQDAAYENPGLPVTRRDSGIRGGFNQRDNGPILQYGDSIYLIGQGASKEGDRPFLDRLNLKTLQSERLFRSGNDEYEMPIAPLNDDASTILTQRETPNDPPNYSAGDRQLTSFKDPQPQLRGVTKEYVTYQRKDGVTSP
jgi:dipeptidyl aminopeptidase/acylaminoacyl peptidase